MSASSLMRSSVEILLLSCRYSGENLPSMSKLPWASLNTCLETCSHKATAESQLKYVTDYLGILGNLALRLTWPPRQKASWTDPGADTSVWRFWALSELSATPKTKKLCILDNLAGDLNVWIIQSRRGGEPYLRRRLWCMARCSAWCRSVAPSRPALPGRCLRGGWSLRKYP